jgi:superfamily II DNA or RNA helicase
MDVAEQREVLGRFASGQLTVLTNCSMLCEGYDLPAMECVMVMRPTLSEALWIQMCGRGARPCQGKDHYVLLDCSGAVYLHGSPNQDHVWRIGKKDTKATRSSRSVTSQCPKCHFVFLAGETECPNCGATKSRVVKYAHGELVEVKDDIEKKQLSERTIHLRHLYAIGGRVRHLNGNALTAFVSRHMHHYEQVRHRMEWRDYIANYATRDSLAL